MCFENCKNKIFALLTALAIIICSGCTISPQDNFMYNSTSSSSPKSNEPSVSMSQSSLSTSSSDNNIDSDKCETSSSGYNSEQNTEDSTSGEMSYMDYVIEYRDEIINGAIDVEYEHFAAHPTGLKDGYVRFSGEIMQVFEDQKNGYDFYSILMNITYVPGDYSSRYTDTVLVSVIKDFSEAYPSVGDIATVWGMSKGFLTYENIYGEEVSAPHVIAAQITYDSHTDTLPSDGTVEFAASDFLGLTVDEVAVICGHSSSDYTIWEDTASHMAFQADDDMILYSLSGYTSGTVRFIDVLSSNIKITNGYGNIDNVRIGMTETDFLDMVMGYGPESYGVEGLYMFDAGKLSFLFIFNDEHILDSCEVGNYNIIF